MTSGIFPLKEERFMTTRIHFLYRIDMWSRDGERVIEHLAGVDAFVSALQGDAPCLARAMEEIGA
jgi:hypothetical protein